MKKILPAIIPARLESKSVKRKNFKNLKGKILIDYTLSNALESKLIDKVIITTDNLKYLKKLSKNQNKKIILHNRSKKIAGDKSKMISVLKDCVKKLEKLKFNFDYVILLQPTSPFRRLKDIDESIQKIKRSNADTLISVYEVDDNHPARMYTNFKKYLIPILPNLSDKNRQSLPKVFHRNGAIYIVSKKNINKNIIYGKKISFHKMPLINSLNIDNTIDWITCEKIIEKKLIKF